MNQLSNIFKNKKMLVSLVAIVLLVGVLGFYRKELSAVIYNPKSAKITQNPTFENAFLNTDKLTVQLDKTTPELAKQHFTVETTEGDQYKLIWENNASFVAFPASPLKADHDYTLKVLYKNKTVQEYGFKTNKLSFDAIQESMKTQYDDDQKVSKAVNDLVTKYPWYTALPIVRDDFIVVYDYEKDQFRIIITKAGQTSDERLVTLREALLKIYELGVNIADESVYYIVENK